MLRHLEKTRMGSFLIWSSENGAWWAPDGLGYVNHIAQAGRFTHEEALDISRRARA
jgi:hypothetical protein